MLICSQIVYVLLLWDFISLRSHVVHMFLLSDVISPPYDYFTFIHLGHMVSCFRSDVLQCIIHIHMGSCAIPGHNILKSSHLKYLGFFHKV